VRIVAAAALLSQAIQPIHASNPQVYTTFSLSPTWADGIISDSVGPANIFVSDINNEPGVRRNIK
jgi:hypothetical protein